MEGLEVARPERARVADVTCIRLRKEFTYLAVVMGVFARCIRGWHLSRSLERELTIAALRRAMEGGCPGIHQPDQGVQYAATAYVELLRSRGVEIGMASVGEPEENGYAERLMRMIEEEEVDLSEYPDPNNARRQLRRFFDDVYDTKRIHSLFGYLTPGEFEQQWADAQAARRCIIFTINRPFLCPVSNALTLPDCRY